MNPNQNYQFQSTERQQWGGTAAAMVWRQQGAQRLWRGSDAAMVWRQHNGDGAERARRRGNNAIEGEDRRRGSVRRLATRHYEAMRGFFLRENIGGVVATEQRSGGDGDGAVSRVTVTENKRREFAREEKWNSPQGVMLINRLYCLGQKLNRAVAEKISWNSAVFVALMLLFSSCESNTRDFTNQMFEECVNNGNYKVCDEIYVVREGETLQTISEKCGDPYIVEENPHIHDPDDVFPGLVIKINPFNYRP
ncbi:hypothetical protein LR48_Vigan02g072300 [Vigna angularis]|uniref:LysM domain-containing protein n=1 Tax=Phaseolus angularis TaxID=3914 RepID=A0A0L9TVF3_PHAAN|nr:hypothetical protein LR48_Vigan02g072300 [Vigna angularis]